MSISDEIILLNEELPSGVRLVAVSKFHPAEAILEAYNAGQRIFGESRPQELAKKVQELPDDIEWHFIGHLQSNKLKMVLPYVSLIHSVDSRKLLLEIDRYAVNHSMRANVLLEIHIASEETKQGFSFDEADSIMSEFAANPLGGVEICGVMGMASFVADNDKIKSEFLSLKGLFDTLKAKYCGSFPKFREISMGMSGDYKIALECGSTIVRIGTTIFGKREYPSQL